MVDGQVIDLYTLSLGEHTLTVYAMDNAYNSSSMSVTFSVGATISSLKDSLDRFYAEGKISSEDVYMGLMDKLMAALKAKRPGTAVNILNAFISQVNAQAGKSITMDAAELLLMDVQWVIENLY